MKKYRFEIIIFIVDAICMILELVASRLLSPYFGNSNVIWTSVIGIILLSSSIGNYLGGKIADSKNKELSLKTILTSTSIYVILIPLIQKYILNTIVNYVDSIKLGAILATLLLFFFPSLCMGIVTPIIIRLKINDLENAGKSTGKINAIATLGGIIGTFLGGFVLIPELGSTNTLFILTIFLAISIQLVDFKIKQKTTIGVVIIIILSFILMNIYQNYNSKVGEEVLAYKTDDIVSYDTQYGRVWISNRQYKNQDVRILKIDEGFESATFFDDKKYDLVFEYTKYYDLMFKSKNEIDDVLLIGGAGYSYPKYYISHYPDRKMDVVEIDGKITEIAKKYFYLDDLIKDYNINENHRLNLITEDGRTYLNRCEKKYDAILNDAFSGENPAKTLTTLENIKNIKKSLNENGLYLTNIISSLDGSNSKFIKAEVNTLNQVFKNVYAIPCQNLDNSKDVQNIMVIATDDSIKYDNTYDLKIDKNEIIITDDFCPIDKLVPQVK